ncbi:unnamed protein product [Porites lobata]|uniref:Endonuclease/exonuclease/phosphatase domain-containing protein n=1 Tax=Porites lobata TaxID=104759 RepID=A0ABN8NST8_9CNID|nr:unnamed protein product [Porites lobata]
MGKDKADKNPSKRLRENGSQTDEDDEHVGVGGVMSARLEEMNTKLDQVLTACGEIALLKDEIRKLRDEVKNLKQSLQSAEEEIESLQESQKETSAQVKENNEDIDFLFEDIGALRRRNIKLEAYTRRENVRIFNVGEEEDENTEELVRSVFVANLKIPADKVNDIRFERVHRISTDNSSLRAPSYPKPIIARFSHYQDKEYVRSFYKNLKGTNIGFSDDFPKEIEEIHRKLYPVLKKAKQDKQKAFFNFEKLIINGQIYRGKETKDLPYYYKVSGKFYKNLHRVLQTEDLDCEENIIIGGDFNCPLDPKLDKKEKWLLIILNVYKMNWTLSTSGELKIRNLEVTLGAKNLHQFSVV